MKRFNWSPTTYQKIDWEIFTPVYRKQTNKNLKWMNKFCMRKLPVGERIHSRESKFEERCCSCYANCETDDHLIQCPKRQRHRNEIMQTVDRLGKELDPRLHDILKDGLLKYFKGAEQTPYATLGSKSYHQLQTNQRKIGWANLIRGKFSRHWRKHQREFTQENKQFKKIHDMNI